MATSSSDGLDGRFDELISFGLKSSPQEDCRICLEHVGELPIFGNTTKPDISLEVVTFGGIQVNKNDDFPQFICHNCFNLLENAISFRTTAKRTDALLKRRRKRLTQASLPKPDESIIDVELEIPKVSTIQTITDPSMIKIHASYDKRVHHTYQIVTHDNMMDVPDEKPSKPKIDFVSVQVADIIEDNISYCKTESYMNDTNVTHHGNIQSNQLVSHDSSDIDNGNEMILLMGSNENAKCDQYTSYSNNSKPKSSEYTTYETLKPKSSEYANFIDTSKPTTSEYSNYSTITKPTSSSYPTYTVNTKSSEFTNYTDNNTKASDAKPKPENFFCKYCKQNFPTSEVYEEHRNTVQHKRNYVISFLPKKKATSDKDGTTKERKTTRPKDQQCNICNELFTKIQYPRHMLNEHDIKMPPANTKRECKVCKKMIDRRSMPRHVKRKHESDDKDNMEPKVKLECPICKKVFAKQYFPLHMNRHKEIENKKYVCDQCGRKFAFKSSFNTHRLVHTNEYPHKCDYCPYQGRTKGLLKIHLRTHTGDYPFKCTECDTRCLTKSNLNWHMRRHRGPIDFVCGACHRGFYSKLQLERHISVTHYGQKNHICSFCGSAFGYRNGLMRHLRKVHKRPKVRGVGKGKTYPLTPHEQEIVHNKPPEPQMVPPPPQPQHTYMVQNFVY